MHLQPQHAGIVPLTRVALHAHISDSRYIGWSRQPAILTSAVGCTVAGVSIATAAASAVGVSQRRPRRSQLLRKRVSTCAANVRSTADGQDVNLASGIELITIDPAELPEVPAHDSNANAGEEFQIHEIMRHPELPRISIIPNFLTDAEIDHVMELADCRWVPHADWIAEKVNGMGQLNFIDDAIANRRFRFGCALRPAQTTMLADIEARVARLAEIDLKYLERLNMIQYNQGNLFKEHNDGAYRPKTVFIYLNDVEPGNGGETHFPHLKLQVTPRKGCAVMWSNYEQVGVENALVRHEGLPTKRGMKYAMNCFFNVLECGGR